MRPRLMPRCQLPPSPTKMLSPEEKEKRNKQIGMLVSAGAHIAVLLLFIFLVAWRAPNPPLPEFGIELNFGTSNQGTGDIQPETAPAESASEDQATPDSPEEVIEEMVEEATPVQEETETVPDITETETTRAEEVITPVTTRETEAPVNEPETKPVDKKKIVKEPKKEEPKPQPPKVLYPGKKDGAAGTAGDKNTPANANQGDKTGTVGDQGNPEGNVDAPSQEGKAGGDSGSSLEITGWWWEMEPNPLDKTSEDGKITFEFQVNDKGEVISIKKVAPTTVTESLVSIYKEALMETIFYKEGTGTTEEITKGKVTFIIKAK